MGRNDSAFHANFFGGIEAEEAIALGESFIIDLRELVKISATTRVTVRLMGGLGLLSKLELGPS